MHTWTVRSLVPDYRPRYATHYNYLGERDDYDLTSYVITDVIQSGLSYEGGFTLSPLTRNTHYTVSEPATGSAGTLTVTFTAAGLTQLENYAGQYLTMTYDTSINNAATAGTRIYNQASVRSVCNRRRDGTQTLTDDSEQPYVYTGEAVVQKVNDKNNAPLQGAVFEAYTSDGNVVRKKTVRGTAYPVNYGDAGYGSLTENYRVTTGPDGKAVFFGLKDASYYFREVTPPPGFLPQTADSSIVTVTDGRMYGTAAVIIRDKPYPIAKLVKEVDRNEWLTGQPQTWTLTGTVPEGFSTNADYANCVYEFIDEIDYQRPASAKRIDYAGNVTVNITGVRPVTLAEGTDYEVVTESEYDGTSQRVVKITVRLKAPGLAQLESRAKQGTGEAEQVRVVMTYQTRINERAHELEKIPNRADLNYSGYGLTRYAKTDLKVTAPDDPFTAWNPASPEAPGVPDTPGIPGGSLTARNHLPESVKMDDPYVYTPYRQLKINKIINRKNDFDIFSANEPYEDISFIFDVNGSPCYDSTQRLHYTVVINPDGTVAGYNLSKYATSLDAQVAKAGSETLLFLPPGTYTVTERRPMRYTNAEAYAETPNASVSGSAAYRTLAVTNNLVTYAAAEDTFINEIKQWNMFSSADLKDNTPGYRETPKGEISLVFYDGGKNVMLQNAAGQAVFQQTGVYNCLAEGLDYGTYTVYYNGSPVGTVDLQQYSVQVRFRQTYI